MTARVAIIGLGLAGLSAAYHLAKRGYSVTGFEQFDLLHDRGSSHGDTRIYRRVPFEGISYTRLAEICYPLWRDWSAQLSDPIFVQSGGIDICFPGHDRFDTLLSLNSKSGVPYEVLNETDIRQRFPLFCLKDGARAVYQPLSGYICPDRTKLFLHSIALAQGANLIFGVKAALSTDGRSLVVEEKKYDFDFIILSAGSWIPKMVGGIYLDHLKIERQVLAWYRPKDAFSSRVLQAPISCITGGFYGMPTPSGDYKIGLMHHLNEVVEPDNVHGINEIDKDLMDDIAARYLDGVESSARQYKTCLFTEATDHDFIVDWHPESDRTVILSCCSGHGAKYAPALGMLAADLVSGENQTGVVDSFRAKRFSS